MQNILFQSLNKAEVQELIFQAVQTAMEKYISRSSGLTKSSTDVVLLSKKEAALYLKISSPTLSKYINEGFIKAHTIAGTRMRFKACELDKALKELRAIR